MLWLNIHPPLEARSASSSSQVKEMWEERLRIATAISTRWHQGHALPTYKWYLLRSTFDFLGRENKRFNRCASLNERQFARTEQCQIRSNEVPRTCWAPMGTEGHQFCSQRSMMVFDIRPLRPEAPVPEHRTCFQC